MPQKRIKQKINIISVIEILRLSIHLLLHCKNWLRLAHKTCLCFNVKKMRLWVRTWYGMKSKMFTPTPGQLCVSTAGLLQLIFYTHELRNNFMFHYKILMTISLNYNVTSFKFSLFPYSFASSNIKTNFHKFTCQSN